MRNSSSDHIQKLVDQMEQQEQSEQQGEQSAADFAEHLKTRKGNQ